MKARPTTLSRQAGRNRPSTPPHAPGRFSGLAQARPAPGARNARRAWGCGGPHATFRQHGCAETMVQINFALKEVNCKVVFYGPGMSGKTTNLEIVHQK